MRTCRLLLCALLAMEVFCPGLCTDEIIIKKKIIPHLNITDKVGMMGNNARASKHGNIGEYQWWGEGLHGVAHSPSITFGAKTPSATSFPQVITTAASFNVTLFEMIGAAVGDEARAFINDGGAAGRTFWTPNINIFRDPRWGRGQETPGEDPFLTSLYATAFVRHFQAEARVPVLDATGKQHSVRRVKASACCKHFFDYNLEDADGVIRLQYDANPSKQDIADTYLPPFEACVRRAGATALMCSYNAVDGVPSCANSWLLNDTARATWGFDGYITSDCGAISAIIEQHQYTKTPNETVKAALEAGTDLDCGSYYAQHLEAAVGKSNPWTQKVDQAITRLLQVQFWLGVWDAQFYPHLPDPFAHIRYKTHGPDNVRHRQLALEAARQGMVLLENMDLALPLRPTNKWCDKDFYLAVIGPHSEATVAMLGNYYGVPPFLVSPLEGIRRKIAGLYLPCVVSVRTAAGCVSPSKCSAAMQQEAAALARLAGAVVVVMGIGQDEEREGHDRTSLLLPPDQIAMLTQLDHARNTSAPTVSVVLSGGPLDLCTVPGGLRRNVIWAGYPGQSGGEAVADALFGVPPSGRLPVSWYPEAFVHVTHMTENRMRPFTRRGAGRGGVPVDQCSPGRSYRFYVSESVHEGCPGTADLRLLYQFGYGLSSYGLGWQYTQLRVGWTDSGKLAVSVLALAPSLVETTHSLLLFAVPPPGLVYGQPGRFLIGIAHARLDMAQAWFEPVHPDTQMRIAADGPGRTGQWVLPDFKAQRWTVQVGCIPGTSNTECAVEPVPSPPGDGESGQHSTPTEAERNVVV